jgi:hypothetical protein
MERRTPRLGIPEEVPEGGPPAFDVTLKVPRAVQRVKDIGLGGIATDLTCRN